MNDALELYKDDEKAGAVSGYLNPMYADKGFPQSFFSYSLDSWGWGTWQRSWKDFESDARILIKKIKEAGLEEKYNYGLKYKTRTVDLREPQNISSGTVSSARHCFFTAGMFSNPAKHSRTILALTDPGFTARRRIIGGLLEM